MANEHVRQGTRAPKIDAVVAQARRVAAAVRESVPAEDRDCVGPRELFIAAALRSPQLVAELVQRAGLHLRRVVLALEEWPIKEVAPAQMERVMLSPAAQSLLADARSDEAQGSRRLVARLLDSDALPAPANASEDGAAPDATAKVLSRLGLI